MITTLRTAFLSGIFIFLFVDFAKAQPNKGEFIEVAIGLGFSYPDEDANIYGSGFYAQAEYAFALTR